MVKFLVRIIGWLQWIGIITSTDNNGVPEKNPNAKQRIAAELRLFWHVLLPAANLVPQIAYMFLRTADVLEMAHSLYPVSSILGCTLQFLVLAAHRTEFNELLNAMQQFVNLKDACNERNTIFNDAEAKAALHSKVFERLLFATWVFYVSIPAILEFQAYRGGTTNSVHTDVGLFMDLYFFNVSISPTREICYIIQAIGVYAAIDLFITIDLVFLGLCLYVVAMYKELQRMLCCIDRNVKVLLTRNGNDLYYRRCLCECIDFHLAVISFTDTINNIYSHIIFLQYCSSMLAICANVFEASFANSTSLINIGMTGMCYVTELFLFCGFGQLVHEETNKLQATLYDLRWWEYGIDEQKMVKLMILRSQKPCGLAAYNYFACDLPTFFKIMSNVYSIVAFLQGLI